MEPRRHRFLIVDDEADVLDSLRHLFHRRYQVVTARSGEEALEVLEREDVQIILSDQRMPGMTGDEFLRRARERQPQAVRLLFTGYADIQAIIDAVNRGGIFRYLHKPWDPVELEALVAQAAEQYELLAERRRLVGELTAANEQLSRANQELSEALELKSAFLEVASHELNTPITIIQGLSDLLRLMDPDRAEPDREIIGQITESARQLGKLVSNMLQLLRSDDFRRPVRLEPVLLADLLREVAEQVRPFVRTRRLEFAVDVAGDLGAFDIDAPKIRDAVLNLLTNAIKFTPDGGQIALQARLDAPDEAAIVVEDRGIGLDPRALNRLFEPFFTQFDPSRHSSGGMAFGKRGMGLGLYLVKKFVELHGGTVAAESAVGEGTRITIRLPRHWSGPGGVGLQCGPASPTRATDPARPPGPG